MLWRAVLTAIAISCTFLRENLAHVKGQGSPLIQIKDVICVLLLSGLQKEDLDAYTMEKLRKHNVNIYDMNNESLRQECLLNSLLTAKSAQGLNIAEEKNDTSFITIHQETKSEIRNIPVTQKPDMTLKNFITNENLRILMNAIKRKSLPIKQTQITPMMPKDAIRSKKNKGNEPNQPNLESVQIFWDKLKQTGQSKAPLKTTTMLPIRNRIESIELLGTLLDEAKSELNSKEVEYLNSMLTEYLDDNEGTTTQNTDTISKKFDVISRKVSDILGEKKLYSDMDPISYSSATTAFTNKPNFENVIKMNSNNHYLMADEVLPSQKELNFENIEQMNNNTALQYISNILEKHKKTNPPITHLELVKQSPKNTKSQIVNVINNSNNPTPVPTNNVLETIANMVKDIIMRDLKKVYPARRMTLHNVTEKPVPSDKEASEGKQMMHQILALFKQFNVMQETTDIPDTVTKNEVNTSIKNTSISKHTPKFEPIPLGPADMGLQGSLYLPNFKEKLSPITFQTNSGEIPPLGIQQVSKPTIHQQGTSADPLENSNTDKYSTLQPQHHDHSPVQHILKKEFRDPYRIQKLKERIANAREENRAHQVSESPGTNNVIMHRHVKPHHGGEGRVVGSGQPDLLNRNYNGDYPGGVNRPLESSHQSLINPDYANRYDLLKRPLAEGHHESFNNPIELRYDAVSRPDNLNQRDVITREVLSRLVGSNQHDVVSRLVEPSRHSALNRAMDLNQQSRSHHSDAYERIEHEQTRPLLKSPRFHEELEQIRPSNNQKAPCCDIIARQQMPIGKLKQHPKFDDAHFRNFLKSQQKVTDMLEKILAAKSKPKPHIVETP